MPQLVPFPVDRTDITPYYEALAAALSGDGPALAPYDAGQSAPELPAVDDAPDDLALVVATSGSTGSPKLAMLTRGALIASANATAERIGAGTWLLPLPPHHIAGTQVIVRSIVAGTTPIALPTWSLDAFVKATTLVARNAPPFSPIHTSLVPTQLRDVLEDERAVAAARRYRSILVGGASTPAPLQARAREAGLDIVTTYGSSETAGGCVYDGVPLDGVTIRVLDENLTPVPAGASGRIALEGPMLASGYLGDAERSAATFVCLPASDAPEAGAGAPRAFLTDDIGRFDGVLHVEGRVDDVITTGGYKVSPTVVEDAVRSIEGVADVIATGRPHERWGECVAVSVVTAPGVEATPQFYERLLTDSRKLLPPYAVPTLVRVEQTLPLKGIGKPDRAFVARQEQWHTLR